MSSDTRRLVLVIVAIQAGLFGSVASVHHLFPGYEHWGFVPAAGVFCVAMAWLIHTARVEKMRTRAPVAQAIASVGIMESLEREYQERLLRGIRAQLQTQSVKPEAPLPSGTRVDGRFEHAGAEWYLTIKRQVENQQRLVVQGEIEDIIQAVERQEGGDVWILVVAGLIPNPSATATAQLHALREYAAQRQSVHAADRNRKRHINIEVFAVEMAA